ncbi:hypothetical protein, partial [Salibacterium halotolerans]|uniref:hypothetical protein n=1 Tax=Salibacterium halotolerans TaxID=1884432 RepID=UPI001BAEFB90
FEVDDFSSDTPYYTKGALFCSKLTFSPNRNAPYPHKRLFAFIDVMLKLFRIDTGHIFKGEKGRDCRFTSAYLQ